MPESSWEGDHRTRLRLGIALETKKRWFRDTIQVPCLQNNLCVIRRTAILWLIMVLERHLFSSFDAHSRVSPVRFAGKIVLMVPP